MKKNNGFEQFSIVFEQMQYVLWNEKKSKRKYNLRATFSLQRFIERIRLKEFQP